MQVPGMTVMMSPVRTRNVANWHLWIWKHVCLPKVIVVFSTLQQGQIQGGSLGSGDPPSKLCLF